MNKANARGLSTRFQQLNFISADSVSDVQAILEHKSPETSSGYSHASGKMIKIKSPFDYI